MIRRAPHRMRGRWGSSGTAAVEFALVLPMLLALLIGTVEVGFLILSHASMNATMARVPDLVRRAADEDMEDLKTQLDALAELPLGLGLADVTFDPVVEECVCPADAIRFLEDDETRPWTCPVFCSAGVDPLRFYTITGRVAVPSLIPRADIGGRRSCPEVTPREDIGVRRTCAKVTVMGP